MNDNLPEIDFKEKKKEKKGLLPWLKSRLGFGARGSMGGVEQAGGAFRGAAKFGASSGIGTLLAGKAGLIVTAAIVAVGAGVYMANNNNAPSTSQSSAFSKAPDNYVPAILRSQAANQGSSLDMFKDANKSSGISSEEEVARKAAEEAAIKARQEEEAARRAEEEAARRAEAEAAQYTDGNMAQDMIGKMQGSSLSSLSSSLGGSMSGGKSIMGPKASLTGGVGAGFKGLPNFDQRKKLLAMKASSKPVLNMKRGRSAKFGSGAYNQAQGLRATQKSYTGTNIDAARATQDKAWEGSTAEGGVVPPGAGVSPGGAGIVPSSSLDNGGSTGGGAPSGPPSSEPLIAADMGGASYGPAPGEDVSPWKELVKNLMIALWLSIGLATVAGFMPPGPWKVAAAALAGIAAAAVIAMAVILMVEHGQKLAGMIYMTAGLLAVAGAVAAAVFIAPPTWMLITLATSGMLGFVSGMLPPQDQIQLDIPIATEAPTTDLPAEVP